MAPKRRPGRGRSLIGTSHWQTVIRPRILKRDRNTCQACLRVFPPEMLDVDHILPRALNGSDHPENLQALCRPCHRAKDHGQKRPLEPPPPKPTHPAMPILRGRLEKSKR